MPYSVDTPEVTLTLRAEDDEIGTRTLVLNYQGWSVQVGRGSQTEEHLRPQFNNAWFGSRVMSRAHAEIKVDPITRDVTLTDIGSMHGTYIDGRRLQPQEQAIIVQGKVVTFGADILRGELTYQALQLKISYQWSDEYAARMQHWQSGLKAPSLILDEARSTSRHSNYLTAKNSYSLDYSDDEPMSEDLSDHEVEVVYESAVQHDFKKVAHLDRHVDDESASSSESAEHQEDSAPTSPAEEHVAHKIEVPSSQLKEDDVIMIKEQQSKRKVTIEPQPSHHQTSGLQVGSDSVQAQGETVDLISEMSNSDDEDEGYDELDNFSELDSEQGWNIPDIKSIDAAKSDEVEKQGVCENRAVSPSDAAMPKQVTRGTSRQDQDQDRALPETFAPLSFPPSMSFPYYGNNQSVDFTSTSDGLLNRLPSIRPVTWFDQSLGSSVYPEYRFAPTPFGYQINQSPSNAAKVSINSIIDEASSGPTNGSKRKRQADDEGQVDQVHEKAISDTDNVPETLTTLTATVPHVHTDELTKLQAALDNIVPIEGSPKNSAGNVQQADQVTYKTLPLDDPALDSDVRQIKDFSEEAGAERPRKRIRTQESETSSTSRGRTMIKYAATVLVGAAVGSIGTVFGLAALPADYFL